MILYSSPTQTVLSLLSFKIANPRQIISKYFSANEYVFFFETERMLVCDCYDYCSHSCGEFPPRTIFISIALYYVHISVKTVCLIGYRE